MTDPRHVTVSPSKAFAVVAVAVFLATLDMFIVNIAFPAIRAGFAGASVSDVSWVLNIYAIAFAERPDRTTSSTPSTTRGRSCRARRWRQRSPWP
jgi:hypothetical protein